MVYCGKPSKGCRNCRQRKIRCDTALPIYGQCIKANKTCDGYRNQLDLAFRNESDSVIEKARAKSEKRVKTKGAAATPPPFTKRNSARKNTTNINVSDLLTGSVSSDSSPGTVLINYANPDDLSPYLNNSDFSDDNALSLSPSRWPTFSLCPTIEELGTNFFLQNFVARCNGPSHGHFNYLHDFCRHEQGMDPMLRASVVAGGLATLANTSKSPELMGQARINYMAALRNINTALKSAADAIKDSTLISIMAVSIFEAITGCTRMSLKAWTEHINGALALLKLRGRSQIQTITGLQLFIHVTSHLLVSCVQRELPMPPQLLELRLEAFQLVPPDPAWQFLKIIDDFTVFRAAVKGGTLSDPDTIISTALRYDGDLVRIFSSVPPDWLYETVYTDDDSNIIWNGCYDIYHDYWIAQIWNGMRSTRIMLNETIRARLLQGFTASPPSFMTPEYTAQFQSSTDVLVGMRDGILRSIPQHFGYVTRKPFTHPSQSTSRSRTASPPFDGPLFTDLLEGTATFSKHGSPQTPPRCKSSPPTNLTPPPSTPAIGGYFLLWPLYASGVTRVSTPETRAFVIKCLRYVGDTMGIMQGNGLANFLSMGAVAGMQSGGVKALKSLGCSKDQRGMTEKKATTEIPGDEGLRHMGDVRLPRNLDS